jgi:Tfp pilus assembly protein PilX
MSLEAKSWRCWVVAALEPGARSRDERGFAVPTVMAALIAAFALATTTLVAVTPAQRGSIRDQDMKEALAAAEAGVSEALLHYNRIPSTGATPLPCIAGGIAARSVLADGTAIPDGQKWCEGVERQVTGVADASYTYWVRPSADQKQLEIVSEGSVSGVTRKVEVVARSSTGIFPFTDASVIGLNSISLDSNSHITADVATNGDITVLSNSEIDCNYAQIGLGRQIVGDDQDVTCEPPSEGSMSLPPVNQGDVPTNNSNIRITSGQDTWTKSPPTWSGHGTGAGTRQLTLNGNQSLTLGGTNYSFCKLTLNSNTNLFIASGATVRIYFDTPENCGLLSPATQLTMNSNSSIQATGSSPTHLSLLFVGSGSGGVTRAQLNSNTQANYACQHDFVIYGPRTDIEMDSNSYFCGAMAGKSIHLDSNSDIETNNLAEDYQVPADVIQHYTAEEFRDCAASPPAPAPDYGC